MSNSSTPSASGALSSASATPAGRPSRQTPDSAPVLASESRWGSFIWWGAAALSLIVGFADLWRGGQTLSAIMLTIGYLVLVPIAILKR